MSGLGHERLPFKWRLPVNFRYAPGSDRGRVAAQYVAMGQQQTHAPQQMGRYSITSSAAVNNIGGNSSLSDVAAF